MRLIFGLLLLLACFERVDAQAERRRAQQAQTNAAAGGAANCDSVNDSSLKAYWKFDDTADDSKGANDLTLSGSPSYAAAKINNGLDLEVGSTQYASIADNAELSVGGTDFSVACWVRFESLATHMGIINKPAEYDLRYNASQGKIQFGVGNLNESALWTDAASDSTWYFIVGRFDDTANEVSISINGGAFQTASVTGVVADQSTTVYVGALDGPAFHIDGIIDELLFTKRLLTTDEVAALYNAGAGCRPSGL